MIFMVWLMLAVLSVVAVFLGMILDIEGLRSGWKIGRRCTVAGLAGFAGFAVSVLGFIVSLFVHVQ